MVCECGGEIGIIAPHIEQKIDIPEIKAHVTDYCMELGRCKLCKKMKTSSLPAMLLQAYLPHVSML